MKGVFWVGNRVSKTSQRMSDGASLISGSLWYKWFGGLGKEGFVKRR